MDARATRTDSAADGARTVERSGDPGDNSPSLIWTPARVHKIVSDRRKGIGFAPPDIDSPVSVPIAGNPQDDRRQELRIASRSCPASLQNLTGNAAIDQLQRVDEFLLEQCAAAPFIRKACKRTRQIEIAGKSSIIGFIAPDRHHD